MPTCSADSRRDHTGSTSCGSARIHFCAAPSTLSRFFTVTCGTRTNSGTVVRPASRVNAAPWRRPMFAVARPRFVSRTLSATSKLGLPRRYTNRSRSPWMRSHVPGVIFRRPSPKRPAAGVGMARNRPCFERMTAPSAYRRTMPGAFDHTYPAAPMLGWPFGYTSPRQVLASREPRPAAVIWPRNSAFNPSVASRIPAVTARSAAPSSAFNSAFRSP